MYGTYVLYAVLKCFIDKAGLHYAVEMELVTKNTYIFRIWVIVLLQMNVASIFEKTWPYNFILI